MMTRLTLLMLAAALNAAFALQSTDPDLVIVNGKVFTAEPAAPWTEAVAVRGALIVETGTTQAIRARAGAATRIIDAGGRLVIPGINDAHTHVGTRPAGVALRFAGNDPTLAEVLDVLKAALPAARPADWFYGSVGERIVWDVKAQAALDSAAPGRIVKLTGWTGHGTILSTAAMRALGIGDRDPDPPFGKYGRTPGGTLNGILEEYADIRAGRAMTTLAGREAAIASLRRLSDEAVGYGITTIQAMANSIPAGDLAGMLAAANTAIRWRVIRFPVAMTEEGDPGSWARVQRAPNSLVSVGGVKWVVDGTPVERLTATNEPYADRKDWTGRLNLTPEEIELVLRRSLAGSYQVMFHATGDRTIDTIFTIMERVAPAAEWRRARVRLEHGDFLGGARIARARALGVVLVQNPSHFTIGDLFVARFGTARSAQMETLKAVVDAGVPLALGGDGPLNPFLNMMWAVSNATNPAQSLSREQAVLAYTSGSAFAEFAEQQKGRLAKGMLADISVLSQDIFTVPLNKLPETQAVITMVNGRVVKYALAP